MENIWVVAADKVHARLFRAENITGPLNEVRDMVNPESRLQERELRTDVPGRTFSFSGGGPEHRHAYDEASEKEHQARRFANEVADALDHLRATGELERLHVLAEPGFLGELRAQYSHELQKCVASEVAKRATDRRAEEVREMLPRRM